MPTDVGTALANIALRANHVGMRCQMRTLQNVACRCLLQGCCIAIVAEGLPEASGGVNVQCRHSSHLVIAKTQRVLCWHMCDRVHTRGAVAHNAQEFGVPMKYYMMKAVCAPETEDVCVAPDPNDKHSEGAA